MNNLIKVFIGIFLCLTMGSFAQEREYELSSNPLLFKAKSNSIENKVATFYKKRLVFIKDTLPLSLPFVDDFSSNKFTSYDTSLYSASAKSDSIRYSYRINGFIPVQDTINYITDTAYAYTYDPQSNLLDSIALAPAFNLTLFDNINQPSLATDTFDVWNPYFRPVYDTLADTLITNVLVKLFTTKILEIDSITFINTKLFNRPSLWFENEVFLNSTFPINPPSIGVATFDGLDSTGYPYNFANPVAYGLADKLSSKFLNLGIPLGPNDSIVLSFYCQPKGLGNTPESTDSLVLDFKQPNGTWSHVWSLPGRNLIFPDTLFQKVKISIKAGSQYLYNGFQFRFKNYATLSGNVDHWHLDYVTLKKVSLPQDTVVRDIAFVYPAQSMLKDFQAIPYSQFVPSMMKDKVRNSIVNLNTVTENFQSYTYSVTDNDANVVYNYPNAGSQNIPSYQNGYYSFAPHTNPPVNFVYPDSGRCKDFTITHALAIAGLPGTDQINSNDTVRFVQHLTNYFAYDDATAESAYGLVQSGAQGALAFTLNTTDTMNAVYIYFNPSVFNASDKVFRLRIWNDAGGIPGAVIYQSQKVFSPTYARIINGFLRYELDSGIQLSGKFYVGWFQSTANELNIGLDKNTNNGDKLFFNIGSGWSQSIISGSLMLHPEFKSCPLLYISVPENSRLSANDIQVYPNPAKELLHLRSNKNLYAQISILDLSGKIILSQLQNTSEAISIAHLAPGIYFVRIENQDQNIFVNKKIVVIH